MKNTYTQTQLFYKQRTAINRQRLHDMHPAYFK